MKKLAMIVAVGLILAASATAGANTPDSSTMWFQETGTHTLTDEGGGIYSGVLPMVDEAAQSMGDGVAGYDVYGKNGATARFGNDPGSGPVWTSQAIGADHDAWPGWNPDTPDWYQYSLNLYVDGGQQKWAVRNHAGATAAIPWSSNPATYPARGVPMSGTMNWTTMFAAETDIGAYISGTGTAEIPGGAAGQGSCAPAWDMDWSWGSELVPLEYAGFDVEITGSAGSYTVSLTPVPEPATLMLIAVGVPFLLKRRRNA